MVSTPSPSPSWPAQLRPDRSLDRRIGNFFVFEPLGGDVACAPDAKVFNSNEAGESAILTQSDQTDGCPAPERGFCGCWSGCPRNFNFAAAGSAPFAVEVQADNGDGTIRVLGAAVNGGELVVNCGQEHVDEPVNGDQGIRHRWIWRCEFP
ncbi:uncharacterized protein DNG_10219 [Cephalotrichum gorgonifer]|uniref:Uncharacterized protein n=1 Tax=Cephalotrichum gorgonifer TaxID=2041049 RepID=A0AAE8N9B9_9PEZI|nr:uncharacterized protein DNG_10219 [Cephalotrichum gorgonifer]